MSIKYYSFTPLSREEPTTVFKFYDTEDLPPKRYVANTGWTEDKNLYTLIANGQLTEEEEISEEQAQQIIQRLDSDNG